jgi:hypothetical protein
MRQVRCPDFLRKAVTINLTSNDFSTNGDPGAPYITACV